MKLVLLRHLESEKNVENRFSSTNIDRRFGLSQIGHRQAQAYNELLHAYSNNLDNVVVYYSESLRSEETAKEVFSDLNVQIKCIGGIVSSKSGIAQGISSGEAYNKYPEYSEDLYRYRCGLLSVYDFRKLDGRESKRDYEKRVVKSITRVINNELNKEIIFIIMHHSSITSAIIHFARQYLGYPSDFYGYIRSNFGNGYLVDTCTKSIQLCDENLYCICSYLW